MMLSRLLAVLLVVAATLWIGSGVFGRTEAPESAATEPAAPAAQPLFKVAVVEAKLESHARRLVLSGRTEADDRASAVARAAGTIIELKAHRGDVVAKGDVLAILSDEARKAQVAEAEAMLSKRRTDLDAKLKLIDRGFMAANERSQLEADLRAAEAALASAEAERDRGVVRAPIAGVVSSVPVSTGQAMMTGGTVAEIVALDPMLAVAEVAERQLGGIKAGDPAEVHVVTGQTVAGTVRFVSPTASSGTRTYRVDVVLDNHDGQVPDGVTAEVALKLAPVDAVRVPRSALTFSADGTLSVRTVGKDSVVASVPVAIVEDASQEIWVSGPTDGARVIVEGQDFVKDGQTVEAVAASEDGAPALVSRAS